MNFPSFKINEYLIPEFSLERGKMFRFWIEIIPRKETDSNGFKISKKIQKSIINYSIENYNLKIHICLDKVKLKTLDFLKPITVREYLKSKLNLDNSKVDFILTSFEIKPSCEIRKLNQQNQKIVSIIEGIESNKITVFDFFGLSAQQEEDLMTYLTTKLEEGKILIANDNLYYKTKDSENKLVEDIFVNRV